MRRNTRNTRLRHFRTSTMAVLEGSANTSPAWVQSADEEDDHVDATSYLLPRTPTSARHACHNFMPTPKSNVPGRKFDHAREGAPVTLGTPISDSALKWKQFAQATSHSGDHADRPVSSRGGQIVDDDWMKENMPDLETPWEPIDEEKDDERMKGFWLFSPAKRRRKLLRFPMEFHAAHVSFAFMVARSTYERSLGALS